MFIGVFTAAVAIMDGRITLGDLQPPAPSDATAPVTITARPVVREVRALVRPPPDQYFRGCNQARAAGRQNIPSHDPSYRVWMDGDRDGLACEPIPLVRRY